MSESLQMLRQKTSELETALAEVQRELDRADATRRTEAHDRLAGIARDARDWLDRHNRAPEGEGEAATAEARKAEGFLHDIRMHRTEL
ncbi:MAG TPA: hypothetical protein VFJ13_09715 [Paracoccaceae bacterium]|nr:hypothetical protein [Paracoccaceae bacterium]